ncbi:MAG: hypothetical protein ACRC46_11945 [Thermoguttaceae bacterium]
MRYAVIIAASPVVVFSAWSSFIWDWRGAGDAGMLMLASLLMFIAAWCGMWFRDADVGRWACFAMAIVSLCWSAGISCFVANATPNPDEPGLAMIFTALLTFVAVYLALLAVFAVSTVIVESRWNRSLTVPPNDAETTREREQLPEG